MTYHYDILSGTIYTKALPSTKPITNELYNIIIQEAIELRTSQTDYIIFKISPSATHSRQDTLYISINNITIHFYTEQITIHDNLAITINIPYTQYTTLKELVEKYT